MTAEPPSFAGAVKTAESWASLPATVSPTIAGAPGTVAGVTVTGLDAAPTPTAFTARMLTATAVPLARPVMVIGLVGVEAVDQEPPLAV